MPDDAPAPDHDLAPEGVDAVSARADDAGDSFDAIHDVDVATPPYLAYGLLLVFGLVTGLFGVAVAPVRISVGSALVPVGLLVVVAIAVIARAGAWLTGTRLGAGVVAIGWALPTIAFVLAGPGGDVLLPDVTRTWVYLLGTTALLVLAVAVPLPRGARALAAARRHGVPDPGPAHLDDAELEV